MQHPPYFNRINLLVLGLVLCTALVSSAQPAQAVDECKATYRISTRTVTGGIAQAVKWALYVQEADADGDPVFGKQVKTGDTGTKGTAAIEVDLNRNSSFVYALKVYTVNPDIGAFIYWNRQFNCGETRQDHFGLTRLKTVFRTINGSSQKDYTWDFYSQTRDVDDLPIPNKLISKGVSTKAVGASEIFIAPGDYYLKAPAVAGMMYDIPNVTVREGQNTTIEYILSSIRFIAKNEKDERATNLNLEIWSQKYDLSNQPVQDKKLASIKIGETGFADVLLPAGLYAVNAGGVWAYNVRVGANAATEVRIKAKGEPAVMEFTNISEPRKTPSRPENTLVRASNSGRIYVLKNGLRHYIPSMLILTSHGYKAKDTITVSAEEMASYVEGPALQLPSHLAIKDGSVVKGSKSPAVYLIEGKLKRPFLNAASFELSGYNWKDIQTVSDIVLADYAAGSSVEIVQLNDGMIVKTNTSPAVYLVEKGALRAFVSGRVFEAWGYRWQDIKSVVGGALKSYTMGPDIAFGVTDSDQDGLNADDETKYGTDPLKDDTDGDGFMDGTEVRNGYNPKGPGKL